MNIFFGLVAIVVGTLASLIAFRVVALEKFISYSEAQNWHDKYDKIFKVLGPVAVVAGLIFLLW